MRINRVVYLRPHSARGLLPEESDTRRCNAISRGIDMVIFPREALTTLPRFPLPPNAAVNTFLLFGNDVLTSPRKSTPNTPARDPLRPRVFQLFDLKDFGKTRQRRFFLSSLFNFRRWMRLIYMTTWRGPRARTEKLRYAGVEDVATSNGVYDTN